MRMTFSPSVYIGPSWNVVFNFYGKQYMCYPILPLGGSWPDPEEGDVDLAPPLHSPCGPTAWRVPVLCVRWHALSSCPFSLHVGQGALIAWGWWYLGGNILLTPCWICGSLWSSVRECKTCKIANPMSQSNQVFCIGYLNVTNLPNRLKCNTIPSFICLFCTWLIWRKNFDHQADELLIMTMVCPPGSVCLKPDL